MANAPLEPLPLTWTERAALALGRFANDRPRAKTLQQRYLRGVPQRLVRLATRRRIYVHGIQQFLDFAPDRGVVFASNHRSFFDQYIIMLALYEAEVSFAERIYFPVRSNFFYDHPLGPALNFAVSGGVMYPPIFRDSRLTSLNKKALGDLRDALAEPGTVVGIHPEGTRGKGPNPYELLPAQPGVGQIVLQSKPIVFPCFQLGLGNDFAHDIRANFLPGIRKSDPIIVVFGEPVDYSELAAKKPRVALYKKCSDLINLKIQELGAVERELRRKCALGQIPEDDPGWLKNWRHTPLLPSART